jgi:hypothetical protein
MHTQKLLEPRGSIGFESRWNLMNNIIIVEPTGTELEFLKSVWGLGTEEE